jgi:ABC-type antimicrobial peptide transport system permease subunit
LQAAGTYLLSGRNLSWHDDANSPKAALVNQTFARELFARKSALGMHFRMADKTSYEVVGVVEDGKYDSLTERPWPAMFLSLAQNPDSDTTFVVRASVSPDKIMPALSRGLADIDPTLPFTVRTWNDALASVFFPARIATMCLGVMGLLAAILAVTGIFGMAAYSVSKRMRELGIRCALGAQRLEIMRSALGRPFVLLASGSAAGLLLGAMASRLVAGIVYQATPRDPLVLGSALSTMVLLGLAATWIPARHALAIDPAGLLREQ